MNNDYYLILLMKFDYNKSFQSKVAAAIERVGGKAYIIHPDAGTRIE